MGEVYDDMEDQYYAPPSASWLDAIQDQFGSAPWWILSVLVHVTFLLITMTIIVASGKDNDEGTVFTNFVKKEEQEERKEEEIIQREEVEEVETEVIVHEENEEDHMETEDDMDLDMAHGDEDAISDIPLGGTGTVGYLGVGGGGAGLFGYRTGGGRKRALQRGGGGSDTENAVNRALEWLARHQEADGHWDGEKYEGEDTDAGITGLAALAFLGAGHTERTGKYKNTVLKAVKWMISQQDANGCIGKASTRGGLGYHHSICGMALSEAYGMAKVPGTGAAAQKAIDYSINEHQVPYSGWRYSPRQEPDTSVTGWFIMQLKSGKVAGLKVPGEGFQGAINWLDKVTTDDNYSGRTGYQSKQQASRPLTAVGMVGRLFMGWKPDDPLLRGGAEYLLESLPSWGAANEQVNFYYWYYGTLGMFQVGGDYWKKWNVAMKGSLLPTQRRGGDEDGSWDPVGHWCPRGGRVYSTALGALCLEVYYRYLPMYR
ncbi:MAG: terpene cyclase/mutase family protein [Planctomycetes bacterium]|nr:terpene cyclase/mutase family protein [Planctomycetota bacterium]